MSATAFISPENLALLSPCGEGVGCASIPRDADVELMLEVARDEEAAFTALVHQHQKPLFNFFARMGAGSDCEDLVQETFVRLFNYRRRYRPAVRFTPFLYHLARNVWADRGRKSLRVERLAAALHNEILAGDECANERSGETMDLEAALDSLSPKLREVIVLNVYQGLRYQDVAEVLCVPLGTVKSRLNLALSKLKEVLDER